MMTSGVFHFPGLAIDSLQIDVLPPQARKPAEFFFDTVAQKMRKLILLYDFGSLSRFVHHGGYHSVENPENTFKDEQALHASRRNFGMRWEVPLLFRRSRRTSLAIR